MNLRAVLKRPVAIMGAALAASITVALLAHMHRTPAVPSVTFITLAGDRLTTTDLRGKVVLVDFWATTCVVCAREMPSVIETYRTYALRGFEVIAVAMPYDRPDWVADYAKRKALPFRVALDYDATINAAFGGVDATPTSFVIDKQGRIVQRIVGAPDFDRLRATIEAELARPVSG
jgi:peroxiredoxin